MIKPRGPLPLVHGWGVLPHAYARGHLTLLFACRQVRADLAAGKLDALLAEAADDIRHGNTRGL